MMFCPDDDTSDPVEELNNIINKSKDAHSSYLYRQLDGRKDGVIPSAILGALGTNNRDQLVNVLVMDMNSFLPMAPVRTNHRGLKVSVGFANEGVDEPHLHKRMTEVYFMACGTVEMRVGTQTVELTEKQVIVVEPGEAHTFLSSSPDHFHFVIQVPGLVGEEAKADKIVVPRSHLGLA